MAKEVVPGSKVKVKKNNTKDLGLESDKDFEVLEIKTAYVLNHPVHQRIIVWADTVDEVKPNA